MNTPKPKHGQQGAVLIVALIMLVLITIMGVASFNLGRGNLQIVGNMEARQQSQLSAQAAVEEVISNTLFYQQPENVFTASCGPNTRCYDLNKDGTTDVTVRVTPNPSCVTVRQIEMNELKLDDPNDEGCSQGARQDFGITGSNAGKYSLCSNTVWDIRAIGLEENTGARAQVRQGVGVRIPHTDVETSCP